MSKENKLVPKLRFNEYKDEAEWNSKPLKEVCDINPSIKKLPNEFIYIDLESVEDGKLLKKKVTKLDEAPSRAQRYLKSGDIIYQMVRPYQKNNYFFQPTDNFDYVASTGYAQIRPFQSKMYIYQYLHFQKFVDKVLAKSTGSNYPAINSSDLANLLIALPSEKEQQKIADCLSFLDDLITAENQKLDALTKHKKGLMQHLFPAVGEKAPKLRFPEFENDGDWEKETLGKLVDIRSGLSPSTHNLSKRGKIPFLKVEDLNNCIKYQTESREYTNEGTNVVPIKSLIFPKRGAAILLNKLRINKKEVLMDSNLMAVSAKKNVNEEFLYYYILVMGLDKIADTSTIPQINNKHIIPLPILIPSRAEQIKIADCLSSLDERIVVQIQKNEDLKLHKKGLMQQLFPTIN